jgi:hypothetical protein
MATRKEGNSDRESNGLELQRTPAASPETFAAQQGEPAAKTPDRLYEECTAAERKAVKIDLDPIKILFAKSLFFGQALFDPAPVMTADPVKNKEADLKIRTLLWQGGKYRDILEVLRHCANRQKRLFVIARWLKQENVCEPEDIIGPEHFRKLARKNFDFLSESGFEHANRVCVWLPYFKRLLEDLKHRTNAQLVRLGYDRSAVEDARGKRSAVAAACSWLASGEGSADALTLRNAYSRLCGPIRRQRKGYPSTDEPA